ncbi:MAG: GNAT family N-acetyltransferase [Phycisphaeraceae bacterium]
MTQDPTTPSAGPAYRFEMVPEGQRARALSLLLTGQWGEPGTAVDGFRAYIQQQGLSIHRLWVAWEGETPRVAGLVVPNPGRSAMLFLSPTRSRGQIDALGSLIRHVFANLGDLPGHLVQVLLEPSQRLERAAVDQGGFEHLADLAYLQRGLKGPEEPLPTDMPGFRVLRADQAPEGWLERAILDSYEQTLDCPSLVGRRNVEDIVAGHRATGVYDPTLWFLVAPEGSDEPVAVSLINPLMQPGGYELVYLGVSVSARGQGLAMRLLRLGMSRVAERSPHGTMYLAVDLRNTPALRLYRRSGFRQTAERAVFLRTT